MNENQFFEELIISLEQAVENATDNPPTSNS